jgi:fibronectin-binding autotransporter adhesin
MPPTLTLSARRLAPLALVIVSSPTLAQTWDGGGADSNWTTPQNWNPDGLPANNGSANIFFAGFVRLVPVVNVPQDVFGITFTSTAGAFTINGAAPLAIRSGGITNNDTQLQFVNASILVQAPQSWQSLSGDLQFNSPNVILNAPLTINTTTTRSVNLATAVGGTGGITKEGAGTLFLGDVVASSYSGPTIINSGTLRPNEANVLSDSSLVTINAGGTLSLVGVSDAIPALSGPVGGAVVIDGGTLTVDQAAAGTASFLGVISGNGGLTKSGAFTQVLGGANTYTGTTTVTAGRLQLGSANERLPDATDLLITGGTFDLQSFTETVNQLTMPIGTLAGPGLLIANSFNIDGGFISARLGGNASLTKNNPATNAFFTGAGSTYTGSTNVNAGSMFVNAPNALPDTTIVNIAQAGTFGLVNFDDAVAGVTGNGTLQILNATLTVGATNASSQFDGLIEDSGATGNLAKVGTGTFTITGACTYAGTTTINAGTIALFGSERLADTSNLTVNAGAFSLGQYSETLDRVTLAGGSITGTGTLTANFLDLRAGTVHSRLAGPAGINKTTSGTVTLLADNTYTGGTGISDGVLVVAHDSQLGAPSAGLSLTGGTLRVTATTTMARPIFLGGLPVIETSGDLTLTNVPGGQALAKAGPGRLIFPGATSFSSPVTVDAGTLLIPAGGVFAAGSMSTLAAGTISIRDAVVTTATVINAGTLSLEDDARLAALVINSGVLTGSGRIQGTLTNDAAGSARISEGESIHFAGAGVSVNSGLLEIIGGSVEFDAPLTNAASTGLIFARNASLRFDGGLSNFGALAFSFGVTDVFGDVNNRAGGSIVVSGFSSATFVDDVINNGILRTSAGAATVFLGAVSGAGSFPGSGTVFLEGDLRPGNSPGVVEFEGDLVLGSLATLQIELAGTSSFDQIIVDGDAELDGTLDVRLINGFHPTGIGTYSIVIAGSRVQQFSNVLLPADARGLVVRYTDTEVQLRFCSADFNSDGVANSQDFFDYLTAFFAGAPSADFNHNAVVNSQDFFDFLAAFFAGC